MDAVPGLVMRVVEDRVDRGAMEHHREPGVTRQHAGAGQHVELGPRHVERRNDLGRPFRGERGIEDRPIDARLLRHHGRVRDGDVAIRSGNHRGHP